MKEVNPYSVEMDLLIAAGLGTPTEDRCLLRAILRNDGSEMAKDLFGKTIGDTLNAVCHEVISIGPDVKRIEPGEVVIHLSAAADLVDFLNPNARYLWVREKHIAHHWSKADAMKIYESVISSLSNR